MGTPTHIHTKRETETHRMTKTGTEEKQTEIQA